MWELTPLAVTALVLLAVAPPEVQAAAAPIMSGVAEVVYKTRPGSPTPFVYENRGFNQTVAGSGTIRVRVETSPTRWTEAGFALSEPLVSSTYPGDPVAILARDAARDSGTQVEAVARVIHEIARRIAYRSDAEAPTSPSEVLARGEASCVGLSNLTVAALSAIDIHARVVRGLLFDLEGHHSTPHRWVEVHYADVGWVFSDPTESINFVSPLHVVVASPSDPDPEYSAAVVGRQAPRVLARQGRLLATDLRPGRGSMLAERRSANVQFGATVTGFVTSSSAWRLILSGDGLLRELAGRGAEPFSFPGLRAGGYTLEGHFSDGGMSRYGVRLSDGEILELRLVEP